MQDENKIIRVSAIEDEYEWQERLTGLLSGHDSFTLLDIYRDAKQALTGLAKQRPDILIMDVRLPGIDGVSAVQLVKERWPEIRVIMFTVFEEEHLLIKAIRNGASGYLLKNTPPELFLSELKVLAMGGAPLSPELARKILSSLEQGKRDSRGSEELTKREWEILKLMALGMNYRDIAERLGISPHTVRRHIESIYSKMRVHSRSEAIKAYADKVLDPRSE